MKTLFYGGNIITMAEPLYAEAVLVQNEKIIAVGSEAELRGIADEYVDLQGATMLPGFIDAHSTLQSMLLLLRKCRLAGLITMMI